MFKIISKVKLVAGLDDLVIPVHHNARTLIIFGIFLTIGLSVPSNQAFAGGAANGSRGGLLATILGDNGTWSAVANNTSSPMLLYSNSSYGVNMTYPAAWKVVNNVSSLNPSRTVYVVEFDSPAGPTVSLGVDTFNATENPDTYLAESVQAHRNTPSYKNFTLIKTNTGSNPMLGQSPSYTIWYSTVADNGNLLLHKEFGTLIGTKVYFTTFTAKTADCALYEPIADQVAQSLVISTNQTNAGAPPSLVHCPDFRCWI